MVISDYAIRKKTTVFVLMFIFLVTGLYAYLTLPREAAPDVEIPFVIVMTTYQGASPDVVEKTVTIPLERELKSITGIKEMNSMSAEGASMVFMEFETDVDIDDALRDVKDGVDRVKGDLGDADEPVVLELNISEFPVMILNISGRLAQDKERNLIALKAIADELEELIEGVPGVLDAIVVGGLVPEVRIELDPDKLAAYRVPAAALVAKYLSEDVDISGGTTDMGRLKYDIRIPMEFERNVEAAYDIMVQNLGSKGVYLADLATIVASYEEEASAARFNGEDTVSIIIQKQSGKNLLILAAIVKHILNEVRASGKVPAELSFDISNDQSEFVKMIVDDLDNNIFTGFVLIFVVIFLSLGLRNSFFVALAVPFSLLISLTVLAIMDIKLNFVVLFSLILSLGMLVDNAIVIVENIYRHRQEGYGKVEAAMKGTGEVAWPVVTSTLTTICAFAPMLFWPGIVGEFLGYLPRTVIITLLSSLFVALVISPTLCAAFMKVKESSVHEKGARPVGRFMRFYQSFLKTAVVHRKKFVLGSFVLLILAAAAYGMFGKGTQFFPESEPRNGYVDIRLPEGSKLDTTDAVALEIEDIIEKLDMEDGHKDVKFMVSSIGSRGSSGMGFSFGASTPNLARISLEFIDLEKRKTPASVFIKQLRGKLSHFAGVELDVQQEEEGPPSGPPVNVEISGDDYELLAKIAGEAKDIVKNIPGVVGLKDDVERGRPELRVIVDRNKAAVLGLNPLTVGTVIKTAYRGQKVGVFRIGDEEYDVIVIASEYYRRGFHLLDKLYVSTMTGQQIPASTVASWSIVGAPGVIRRIDQRRVVTLSGEVEGRLSPAVRADITKALEPVVQKLPEGYAIRLTGEEEMQQEASEFLSRAFIIAIMLIILVLISQFNSVLLPLIIMVSVLLSLVGVLLGLLVTSTPFVIIMTGMGVISLAGVVVNNAIVLIDYIQKLRGRGLRVVDALVNAAMTRLRPVLLTAITTILGLIPMGIGVSFDFKQGKFNVGTEMAQFWSPMARAVIFGLAFATVLTLIMVPTFFYIVHGTLHFLRTKIRRKGLTDEKFGSYLATAGVMEADAAEEAMRVARESGKLYQDVLALDEYIGPKVTLAQLSDFTGYPVWEDLSRVAVTTRFRYAVSEEDAREYRMVGFCSNARLTLFGPLGEHEGSPDSEKIFLAVCEPLRPDHKEKVKEVSQMMGVNLVPVLTTGEQITTLIERTYSTAEG